MQEKDKYACAEDVVRMIEAAVRLVRELGELGARLGGRQVGAKGAQDAGHTHKKMQLVYFFTLMIPDETPLPSLTSRPSLSIPLFQGESLHDQCTAVTSNLAAKRCYYVAQVPGANNL